MTEFEKMLRLLDQSWYLRSQIVPCLVGPPGIGKTAAVKQHALSHGTGRVVKIVASRCIPSETVGMTMPDHEHHSMDIYNSVQLSSLRDGDILFFDELLEADQYVLSVLLTLIESREMADGTPLPDIQIVAATNETISSATLKLNIRQRFLFAGFELDRDAVWEYIKQQTGLELDRSVLRLLSTDGNGYNVLTPRSLTKMALWMDAAPDSELNTLATMMNELWGNGIGTVLYKARKARDYKSRSPEQQVKDVINQMIVSGAIDMSDELMTEFNEASLEDLLRILQSCPDWDVISTRLESMQVEEEEEEEPDVEF